MVKPCATDPSFRKKWHQPALALAALFLLPACQSVDYSVEREHFVRDTADSDNDALDTRGQIYVNLSESEIAKPYVINVNRVRNFTNKGYAIHAPLVDNRDDFRTHFAVSRTKDYKWFSGLQMRWEF